VLCLHNVSDQPLRVMLDQSWHNTRDLVSGRVIGPDVTLGPYEVIWLQHE
jgi:hypothetical protein